MTQAENHRVRWTLDEYATILRLRTGGMSRAAIAARYNRTEDAIKHALRMARRLAGRAQPATNSRQQVPQSIYWGPMLRWDKTQPRGAYDVN